MANLTPMNTRSAIHALHQRGYSLRQIARTLGKNRRTVRKYVAKVEIKTDVAIIVPVAGDVGEPATVKVYAFTVVTVIVLIPLYAIGTAS